MRKIFEKGFRMSLGGGRRGEGGGGGNRNKSEHFLTTCIKIDWDWQRGSCMVHRVSKVWFMAADKPRIYWYRGFLKIRRWFLRASSLGILSRQIFSIVWNVCSMKTGKVMMGIDCNQFLIKFIFSCNCKN